MQGNSDQYSLKRGRTETQKIDNKLLPQNNTSKAFTKNSHGNSQIDELFDKDETLSLKHIYAIDDATDGIDINPGISKDFYIMAETDEDQMIGSSVDFDKTLEDDRINTQDR